MSQPSSTPFIGQVIAHYHINQRFTIGAGSGLSVYEKVLVPLYANVQFFITQPRKLTPYLECNIGGSFAAAKEANGGFYLSPSIGTQLKLTQKLKMNFALGYEIQKLERLKEHTDEYFHTKFKEKLSHHTGQTHYIYYYILICYFFSILLVINILSFVYVDYFSYLYKIF